jgi:hypothetical protein
VTTQKNLPIQLPTQPVPVINGVAVKGEQHTLTAHSSGSSSYIAIDPNTGMQYKVELPNGQLGDGGLNDPLAAIMNETIVTETTGGECVASANFHCYHVNDFPLLNSTPGIIQDPIDLLLAKCNFPDKRSTMAKPLLLCGPNSNSDPK